MALVLFAAAYYFIAGGRIPGIKLDRSGGALLGALAMVLLGIVPLNRMFSAPTGGHPAIDSGTLVLLFAMMLLAAYLAEAGFFRVAGQWALHRAGSPRALLVWVAVASAALSAFLVNDTVCVMLTPLVLAVLEGTTLPATPFLLAICMASNAGSVATFTGNPQNMLIQGASGIPYGSFAAAMVLPAAAATAIVVLLLLAYFKEELSPARLEPARIAPPLDRRLLGITVLGLVGAVAAFFAGLPMPLSALVAACAVLLLAPLSPRTALERVDYVLLVFFACLFVVTFGLEAGSWADDVLRWLRPVLFGGGFSPMVKFAAFSLLASNVLSNVPYVMLARSWIPALSNAQLGWEVLALSSTLAGNLTLVGSVANLIVFETARQRSRLSFWGYLRVGMPVTLASLAAGMALLWAEQRILG